MTVTKRMRFEILRRDKHTCHYCGAAAPGAKITVDHVLPIALGGSDDPSNLVAACADCNAGKSSSSPDAPIVAAVSDKAAVLAVALDRVAAKRRTKAKDRQATRTLFFELWGYHNDRDGEMYELSLDWQQSIDKFVDLGLTPSDLYDAISIAKANPTQDKWRYFCGVCWSMVRQLQQEAISMTDNWADKPPKWMRK
jgi:hypothetical protein